MTGRAPWAAIPAAKVTACPSAIPTSKKRWGYFSAKLCSPVPSDIAAVMPTNLGCEGARSHIAWPKTSV